MAGFMGFPTKSEGVEIKYFSKLILIPDAPCMVYLPYIWHFMVNATGNIPYMELLGELKDREGSHGGFSTEGTTTVSFRCRRGRLSDFAEQAIHSLGVSWEFKVPPPPNATPPKKE